jgi:cation diffusion facilitator CzcD-associated flavoprotein CzcO
MRSPDLLVIGAGPYGLAVSAHARRHGIDTVTVGAPMGFWREHMPAGMFAPVGTRLASRRGRRAHLRGLPRREGTSRPDVHPIPISVYLDYTDWFAREKGLRSTTSGRALARADDRFEADLDDGERIEVDAVVAAPGIARFAQLPPWASDVCRADRRAHLSTWWISTSCRGARCLIIGGRQSAYEWAALLCDHGAERIDVVHRQDVPGSRLRTGPSSTPTSSTPCGREAGGGPCRPPSGRRSPAGSGRSAG